MKTALAAILLLTAVPANADHRWSESIGDRSNRQAYESQRGYAYENSCFRYEYREEYVPGTSYSKGYVKSYNEKVTVPCPGYVSRPNWRDDYHTPAPTRVYRRPSPDGNECGDGKLAGGILGGGAAAAMSRGDGRWWAIPLGVVVGSAIGCDAAGG